MNSVDLIYRQSFLGGTAAKFDMFFEHANSGTLTEDEVNALENWRK